MAKVGNTSSGAVNATKGPCSKCKSTEGPFYPVKVHSPSGRGRMQRHCDKCRTKV